MAECALCFSSTGSGSGIIRNYSSADSDDFVSLVRQRTRSEHYMRHHLHPLQLPPQPPLDAPAPPPVESPESPSTFSPTASPAIGPVLKEPMVRIESLYDISFEIVGTGRFGAVRRCTDRRSGKPFACKIIMKGLGHPGTTTKRIRNEIKVLHYLSGLPHVVRFQRAYEDHHFVYLIMELCEGAQLSKRRLPEGQARKVFSQIIQAVHYCHLMGVMHRDVKPENLIVADQSGNPSVRLVDFGLSQFFKEGKKYQQLGGTPMYTAPEVLQRSFGKEVDVWSAGVVLYILLSGAYPFPVLAGRFFPRKAAIRRGDFDIKKQPWPSISSPAKELVRKMLNTNPDQRITTAQILEHPWVREEGVPLPAQLPPIFEYFARLRQIREMRFIRRLGLMVMVDELLPERTRHCKEVLASVRAGGEGGLVSFENFHEKVFVMGSRVPKQELRAFVDSDEYKGEREDLTELMAATMPSDWCEDDQMLAWAFEQLREAGTWYINKESLYFYLGILFQRKISKEFVEEALLEVGVTPHGLIDQAKFSKIMKRRGHQQAWMNRIANKMQSCISRCWQEM